MSLHQTSVAREVFCSIYFNKGLNQISLVATLATALYLASVRKHAAACCFFVGKEIIEAGQDQSTNKVGD